MTRHKLIPRDEKLDNFLKNLADGRYKTQRAARAAIGATVGLTDAEKVRAAASVVEHFNPKKPLTAAVPVTPTAPAPEVDIGVQEASKASKAVGDVIGAFIEAKKAQFSAVSLLRKACDGDEKTRYTDAELKSLLSLAVGADSVTAFAGLFHNYHGVIDTQHLNMEDLAENRRFFRFAEVIFNAPSGKRSVTTPLMSYVFGEIASRCEDEKQVKQFEQLVRTMELHVEHIVLAPLVIEFASVEFAAVWAVDHPHRLLQGQLIRRMLVLYLKEELGPEALFEFIGKAQPQQAIFEEVVRTFFSKRQFGDALELLLHVPPMYQDTLFPLFDEVARKHVDPVGLIAFGNAFAGLADKAMIKKRIREWSHPDQETAIDALLEGRDPRDFFNSFGSEATQEEIEDGWRTVLEALGLPRRARPRSHVGSRTEFDEIMQTLNSEKPGG